MCCVPCGSRRLLSVIIRYIYSLFVDSFGWNELYGFCVGRPRRLGRGRGQNCEVVPFSSKMHNSINELINIDRLGPSCSFFSIFLISPSLHLSHLFISLLSPSTEALWHSLDYSLYNCTFSTSYPTPGSLRLISLFVSGCFFFKPSSLFLQYLPPPPPPK